MREPEMSAQVGDVPSDEGALGALVRLLPGQDFHHLLPEVPEQVNALVAGLVHARLELLTAKLAAGMIKLFLNNFSRYFTVPE